MKTPDYAALQAFMVVARERSFTRAAAQLGISQSSLSHTIRGLEERLGLRLLARTTRSVAPTAAGERLLGSLQPAFAQISAELQSLNALKDKPSGLIRISCGEHAARSALWPRIEKFLAQNPDVQVEITVDNGLIDIVTEKFDAGIRHGELVAKDMIALPLGPELRMLPAASPAYFKTYPKPKRPEDLTGHACINIRLPTLGNVYAWEFEKAGRSVNVKVEGPLLTNSVDIRLQAALSGLGIAYLPADVLATYIAKGKLIPVLEDWCPPYAGYHLYYPNRRQPTPAFAAFLAAIRARQASMELP
ncbi:LysR family transcriptional regulator [Aestuariivirga litoralis]|uniref:LysR family transcriptional regulator n=1 Tax=Aestuariivirga litoralis TaxID=2650924 RepID=UPI0018C8047E|nr:LysR family transcriptional regulator [Aestuariivirga litoralis]MBG1232248.1 LysR family transcriptional regulator [Aestuariivirga litoralis]